MHLSIRKNDNSFHPETTMDKDYVLMQWNGRKLTELMANVNSKVVVKNAFCVYAGFRYFLTS